MVAATGIGSGLDIEGLVTQLVAAERAPTETRLLQRESRLTSQLSAFGTLQGALSDLQGSTDTLTNLSTYNQRSSSSSNAEAVTVTADSSAVSGSYSVEISQLAQSQSLASGSFASLTDEIGEGTLTFRFGTATLTPPEGDSQSFDSFTVNPDSETGSVTIDSSNNTLQGLRDAINDADLGVAATIVNDGTGFRLLLNAEDTGADSALEIQVSDSGDGNNTDASGLSRLAFNTDANNLIQTVEARDASFTINGLPITSDTNSVSDVIDGVDFELRATTESTATISVTRNTGAVRSALDGFITSFNNFVNVANNLTAYNVDTDSAGPLQGDFSARSIISQVRTALTGSADGVTGAFSTLSELGLRTQSDGTLSLDDDVFGDAIENNFDDIAAVFAELGVASDSQISFVSAGDDTPVGNYAVEITQLATQASLTGSAITAPTALAPLIIDDNNNTLTISVDGTTSGVINLTQGSYDSGEAFAAELQSRINADSELSSNGASVTVSFSASNELVIQSQSYGSGSTVAIESTESTTSATLGLSVITGTAGVDVQGSIGGVTATGNGQILTAATGAAAEGMSLAVTGGALGSRGSVNLSSGIAVGLTSLIDGFIEDEGLLDLRLDGLQTSVERIADDREALELRMESLEARYRRQFNNLDSLLANLQSTGDFLTQQLDNIPVPGQQNGN